LDYSETLKNVIDKVAYKLGYLKQTMIKKNICMFKMIFNRYIICTKKGKSKTNWKSIHYFIYKGEINLTILFIFWVNTYIVNTLVFWHHKKLFNSHKFKFCHGNYIL